MIEDQHVQIAYRIFSNPEFPFDPSYFSEVDFEAILFWLDTWSQQNSEHFSRI